MARLLIAAGLLVLASSALAQLQVNNFNFTPATYTPALGEAAQRVASNYTGFLFGFPGSSTGKNSVDQTPNGMLQANQVATNPFLTTLPGDGNGQTLVTLGPCAGNTPHTHPRGSEISFLLYGAIEFGMVEENAALNTLVLRNMTANQTIHIPTGILHFSQNPNCEPAAFLANFATKDPGTQTTWNSILQVPNRILNAASGISEANWTSIKTNYPAVTAPGTGNTECMQRCGLTFAATNKLTPIANPSA